MATTNEPAEEGKGSSPEPKKSEGQDPKMVPLEALTEERNKKREAAERAEKAEAELARLRSEKATQPIQPVPQIEELTKQVSELQAAERRRSLSGQLGLDPAQTTAVEQLLSSMPNLNPAEALTIAKLRDPKVFEAVQGSSFDPSQHGILGTTRGAVPAPQPEQDDTKVRIERIKALSTTDQLAADELRHNMIGGMAARAMGLKHHKIPI